MKNIYIIAVIVLMTVILNDTYSKSSFISQIPNGGVFSCITCHVSSGNYDRNQFGQDIARLCMSNGRVNWSSQIAQLDSDGDGYTNGAELQDPSGTWRTGNPNPGNTSLVTNPGNPNSKPTGVIEDLANYGFSITTVSPNPFSNGVNFSFTINVPGIVKAVIYDMRGQQVKHLLSERKDAGNYNLLWDATDNLNNKMQNGIYFLSVQLNNNTMSRKIVLMR